MRNMSMGARLQEKRSGAAAYAAALSLVVLAASGAAGLILHQPWLFPSLGPTVMLFFESPGEPASRPLNTLVGHGVGLAAGTAMLYAFGLQHAPSAPAAGLTPARLLAGAASVALTTLVLTEPVALASMAGAIVLITALGWGLNVLFGLRPAPAKEQPR